MSLSHYRALQKQGELPNVYYLCGNEEWAPVLANFAFFRLSVITGEEDLKSRLLIHAPDLILLDGNLDWAAPIPLIEWLSRLIEAPIVMLTSPSEASTPRIKEAFAAGLHDTLYTPLQEDDLSETLEVLLKFRRHVSLNP